MGREMYEFSRQKILAILEHYVMPHFLQKQKTNKEKQKLDVDALESLQGRSLRGFHGIHVF